MTIRIEPGLALVWRDPATLQLGLDPPRAVVSVPTIEQERFLCGLRDPVERERLAVTASRVGCLPADAAAVLGAASPALVDEPPQRTVLVEVLGAADAPGGGELARAVADMIGAESIGVVRSSPPVHGAVSVPHPMPDFAVLVADHVVDPVVRSAWTVRGVPHLPVVVGDGRVRIGPVVSALDGPCLQCLELHRADDDPAWATLAAQMWGRPAPELGAYRSAAIGVHVVRSVLGQVLPDDGSGAETDQLVVDRTDLSVTRRVVRPHPACACRGLPRTDSPSGRRRAHRPDATRSP